MSHPLEPVLPSVELNETIGGPLGPSTLQALVGWLLRVRPSALLVLRRDNIKHVLQVQDGRVVRADASALVESWDWPDGRWRLEPRPPRIELAPGPSLWSFVLQSIGWILQHEVLAWNPDRVVTVLWDSLHLWCRPHELPPRIAAELWSLSLTRWGDVPAHLREHLAAPLGAATLAGWVRVSSLPPGEPDLSPELHRHAAATERLLRADALARCAETAADPSAARWWRDCALTLSDAATLGWSPAHADR